MKRRDFLVAAGAAPLLVATPQNSDESGFAALFDGRSLDGWSLQDGAEAARVRDTQPAVGAVGTGQPCDFASFVPQLRRLAFGDQETRCERRRYRGVDLRRRFHSGAVARVTGTDVFKCGDLDDDFRGASAGPLTDHQP